MSHLMTDDEYEREVALMADQLMRLKFRRHGVTDLGELEWVAEVARPYWENLVIENTGLPRDVEVLDA